MKSTAVITATAVALYCGAAAAKDFAVPGIIAWSTAKTYGFTFYPSSPMGERCAGGQKRIVGPRDGVNTKLMTSDMAPFTVTLAQVVGGIMIATKPFAARPECVVTFTMFDNKQLKSGWKVKQVKLGGGYVWVQQPSYGTRNLKFRVNLTGRRPNGSSVVIREIVLEGPSNGNWQQAFGAQ